MLFMHNSKNKGLLLIIFGALVVAGIILMFFAASAKVNSFEECEQAGWLVRERIVYSLAFEGPGQIEKECVLWSGRRFTKLTE